jgi:hypothetical protein
MREQREGSECDLGGDEAATVCRRGSAVAVCSRGMQSRAAAKRRVSSTSGRSWGLGGVLGCWGTGCKVAGGWVYGLATRRDINGAAMEGGLNRLCRKKSRREELQEKRSGPSCRRSGSV